MGAASSHGGAEDADPRGAYLDAMQSFATGGAELESMEDQSGIFYGGSSSKEDALADMKKYRSSKAEDIKKRIIKGVVEAMKAMGTRVESDNIHDVLKALPDPRKSEFPADAKLHANVCKRIAKHINEAIGKVIDETDPPEVICRRVHDLVDSFSHGVQWEFLHVYDNIDRALQDMQVAYGVMESSYENLMKRVKSEDVEFDAIKFKEMYEKADREFKLRLQVLNGFLHTNLMPAKNELELAMQYYKADNEVIKRLNLKPGTSDFSDSMAFAITKTATMAAITEKVNKALSEIGMQMEDFMSIKNMRELDDKIESLHENILKKHKNKHQKRKALDKFQGAVEDLRKWFAMTKTNPQYVLGKAEGVAGGAVTRPKRRLASEFRAEKIQKRIGLQKRAKVLFVKQFSRGLYERYDGVLRAVVALGPRIGRDIKTGPRMEELMDAFRRLAIRNLRQRNMDISLLGMVDDVRGREIRDSFLQSLKLIARKANECTSAGDIGGTQYFNALRSAIDELTKYVERYNELRKAKFGAGEGTAVEGAGESSSDSDSDDESSKRGATEVKVDVEIPSEYDDEEDILATEKHGPSKLTVTKETVVEVTPTAVDEKDYKIYGDTVAPPEIPDTSTVSRSKSGGDELSDKYGIYKPSLDDYTPKESFKLEEAIGKMMYFYYVAGVRENLKRVTSDMKEYSTNYEKVLASAMAVKRDELLKEQQRMLDELDKDRDFFNAFLPKNTKDEDRIMPDDQYEYIKDMINIAFEAKINLYRAIEAIELYLKDYTKTVAANPDLVKDIKKVLENNNNIFNWFNEETGNGLANAFDSVPTEEVADIGANKYKTPIVMNDAFKRIREVMAGFYKDKSTNPNELPPHYYMRFEAMIYLLNDPTIQSELKMKVTNATAATTNRQIFTMTGDVNRPLYDYEQIERLQDHLEYAINTFQALQNMMNSFIMVANIANSGELKQTVPPRQIYKYLLNYIVASTVVIGASDYSIAKYDTYVGAANVLAQNELRYYRDTDRAADFGVKQNMFVNGELDPSKFNVSRQAFQNLPAEAKKRPDMEDQTFTDETQYSHILRNQYMKYQVFFGMATSNGRYAHIRNEMFCKDNVFFACALKAMMGKILVTIGLYDLLERDNVLPGEQIPQSQVRLILGGDENEPKPVARPELAELYYRVPRLVELYRKTLEDDKVSPEVVTMITDPEMKYYDLFNIIFDEVDPEAADAGAYSIHECWKLIRVINEIYDEHKDVKKVFDEIYKEVNRRYGLVTRNELEKTEKFRRWRKRTEFEDFVPYSSNKLDILPDDDGLGEFSTVPSDNFILPGVNEPSRKSVELDRTEMHLLDDPNCKKTELLQYKAIKHFRDKINTVFKDIDFSRYTRNVYHNIIEQSKNEMQHAKSADEKLNIAVRLISTDSRMSSLDTRKLLMFHETVVYGLNILNGIYSVVQNWCDFVNGVDLDKFKKQVVARLEEEWDNARKRGGIGAILKDNMGGETEVSKDANLFRVRHPIDWGARSENRQHTANVYQGLIFPMREGIARDKVGINEALSPQLESYVMHLNDSYYGRGGLNPRISAAEMLAAINQLPTSTSEQKEVVASLLARFLFNNEDLMRDILLNVFGLGYDLQGMVDIIFSPNENKIVINYGNLRDNIKDILSDVRYFLEIFRGHLPDTVVAEFEHGHPNKLILESIDDPVKGSLYWLERHFLDDLLRNTENDFEYEKNEKLPVTMSQYNRKLNKTLNILMQKHSTLDPKDPKNDNPAVVFDSSDNTKVNRFIPRAFALTGMPWPRNAPRTAQYFGTAIQPEFILDSAALPTHAGLRAQWNNAAGGVAAGAQANTLRGPTASVYGYDTYDAGYVTKEMNLYDEYGQTISEMLFWNMLKPNSAIGYTGVAVAGNVNPNGFPVPYAIDDPPQGVNLRNVTGNAAMQNLINTQNKKFSDVFPYLMYKRVVVDHRLGLPQPPKLDDVPGAGGPKMYVDDPKHSHALPEDSVILNTYSIKGELGGANSLFFLFNQYIVHFLRTFFDKSNNKIYGQLIKSFMSGPLSADIVNAITNDHATLYPDIHRLIDPLAHGFGHRLDINENVTLLHSVALILRNITQTKGIDGHAFVIQNSSDIPAYMKDNMKANLPTFIKMFDYMFKFTTFVKDVIMDMRLNVGRHKVKNVLHRSYAVNWDIRQVLRDTPLWDAGSPTPAPITSGAFLNWYAQASSRDAALFTRPSDYNAERHFPGYIFTNPVYTRAALNANAKVIVSWNAQKPVNTGGSDLILYKSDEVSNYFMSFMNTISSGADALHKSCRDVLREVVDDHTYMELGEGFIANYKSKNNGNLPVMPISSSLYQLRSISENLGNAGDLEHNRLLPTNAMSDHRFRYYYGTRHVFLYNDKYDAAKYPYVNKLAESYNEVVSEADKITPSKMGAFLERTVGMTRYMTDITFFKGLYGILSQTLPNRTSVLTQKLTRIGSALSIEEGIRGTQYEKLLVYQLQGNVASQSRVLELTESLDQKRAAEHMTAKITTKDTDIGGDREQERKYNIIDLNIVPFNPSAFMRDIPLTNIYNYSYTVERMVAAMFEADATKIEDLDISLNRDANGNPMQFSTKDVFLKLLFHPYSVVGVESVYGFTKESPGNRGQVRQTVNVLAPLQRIFRGDNNLRLGTPKFLSDQLFNKVLFNSLYPRGENAYDAEGGPMYSLGRLLMAKDRAIPPYYGDKNVLRERRVPQIPQPINADENGILVNDSNVNPMLLSFPYREKGGAFRIHNVKINSDSPVLMRQLLVQGYDRFNTNIIRNLFFITNLYRVLRMKLNQELVQNRNMIVSSNNLVTPAITEYGHAHKGNTEVYEDNEIDSAYPRYSAQRRPLYR